MKRSWRRGLLIVCFAVGCAPIKIATRYLFADLTYGGSGGTPPTITAFQLYASLEVEGVTAYRSPSDAASCYRALTPTYLESVGLLASQPPTSAGIDSATQLGCVAASTMKSLATIGACVNALNSDPELLAYSVTRMAGTVEAYARTGATMSATYHKDYADAVVAIQRIAKLLAATPAIATRQADAPALALSGGSANGAFQAGFLFELLSARERALHDLPGDTTSELTSHFGAIVGTSVGALISQLLDLYFADPSALTPTQVKQAQACASYTPTPQTDWPGQATASCFGTTDPSTNTLKWPTKTFPSFEQMQLDPSRVPQKCALMTLYRYFTDVEDQQLMCVEPGPVTNTMGILDEPRIGLVRFDVMSRDIIDMYVSQFSDALINNDAIRVVVSVDSEQNQILGLDERSCYGLPSRPASTGVVAPAGGLQYCLGSGAMASMMLPFFARPVRHTYSGYADTGECGEWLDGGLRSGFPALRALRMTRPTPLLQKVQRRASTDPPLASTLRVLAVDTGRLDGQAASQFKSIADVALNSIGQLASQNDVYESVMAQDEAALRDRAVAAMIKCPEGIHPEAVPNLSPDDSLVLPVFVPADIPDAIVAAAEYSFDRYVMRGLFMWGRIVAMNRILGLVPNGKGPLPTNQQLLSQLGWTAELVAKAVHYVQLDQQAATNPSDRVLYPWARGVTLTQECPDFHALRLAQGTSRVVNQVPDCGEATDKSGRTPQYFVCQPGATEPKEPQ
jgi:Patatin-like phospholipase